MFKTRRVSAKARIRYEHIKPLVKFENGFMEHRKLSEEEMNSYDWTWYKSDWLYFGKERINMDNLSVIGDLKVQYSYEQGNYPTVADVLEQIPQEYISFVKYFYEVYFVPANISKKIFKEEFDKGYMVSIVRLYKKRGDTDIPATEFYGLYPENMANSPIGMTEDEFETLKKEIEKSQR